MTPDVRASAGVTEPAHRFTEQPPSPPSIEAGRPWARGWVALLALQVFVWTAAGFNMDWTLNSISDAHDWQAEPEFSLAPAAWAIGALAGLVMGAVNGFVVSRLTPGLRPGSAIFVALGWCAAFAVLQGTTWSNWYWNLSEVFVNIPLLGAVAAIPAGLFGGYCVARAVVPARSPDGALPWRIAYAAGWASILYIGLAIMLFMGTLEDSILQLGFFVFWLFVAVVGAFWHLFMVRRAPVRWNVL